MATLPSPPLCHLSIGALLSKVIFFLRVQRPTSLLGKNTSVPFNKHKHGDQTNIARAAKADGLEHLGHLLIIYQLQLNDLFYCSVFKCHYLLMGKTVKWPSDGYNMPITDFAVIMATMPIIAYSATIFKVLK